MKELKKEKKKAIKTKGITLIALVITIVVLIILAVISINAIFGENGIFTRINEAEIKHENAIVYEQLQLRVLDIGTNSSISGEMIDKRIELIRQEIMNEEGKVHIKNLIGEELKTGKGTTKDIYIIEYGYLFYINKQEKEILLGNLYGDLPSELQVSYTLNPPEGTLDKIVEIKLKAQDYRKIETIQKPNGEIIDVKERKYELIYPVEANGVYTFVVTNMVGESKECSVTVNNIDDVAPTGNHEITSDVSKGDYQYDTVTIQVNATDNAKVKSITLPDGTVIEGNTASYTTRENKNQFILTDIFGNTSTYEVKFNYIKLVIGYHGYGSDVDYLTNEEFFALQERIETEGEIVIDTDAKYEGNEFLPTKKGYALIMYSFHNREQKPGPFIPEAIALDYEIDIYVPGYRTGWIDFVTPGRSPDSGDYEGAILKIDDVFLENGYTITSKVRALKLPEFSFSELEQKGHYTVYFLPE